MRYEIGQKVLGVHFNLRTLDFRVARFFHIPHVVDFDKGTSKTTIVELEVSEHHKVPDGYDTSRPPKLDCDGFILKRGDDVFHNQYPSASYGQLSDYGNGIFSVHVDDYESYTDIIQYYDLNRYMTERFRFLITSLYKRDPNDWFAIKQHLIELTKQVETEFGYKLVKEIIFNNKNPEFFLLKFKAFEDGDELIDIESYFKEVVKNDDNITYIPPQYDGADGTVSFNIDDYVITIRVNTKPVLGKPVLLQRASDSLLTFDSVADAVKYIIDSRK